MSENATLLGTLNRLLKQPNATAGAIARGETASVANFLAGALACFAIYGLAAGFFQGDQQIVMAALKVPIIVFGTALLCLPSFYVFTSLAGSELSVSRTIGILAGFCAVLGLLMTGMIPISLMRAIISVTSLLTLELIMAAVLPARESGPLDWPGGGDRHGTADHARLAGVRSRPVGGDERRSGGPALCRPAASLRAGRGLGAELPGRPGPLRLRLLGRGDPNLPEH